MSFSNPLLVELVVPKSAENRNRIFDFYKDIGWDVRNDSETEDYIYVSPRILNTPPVIVYGLNSDHEDTKFFINKSIKNPSAYAKGDSLPFVFDLVEVCMAVPTNQDVLDIYMRGGDTLKAHTHVLPRDYYGVKEFRFFDPFNYALRITVDPGWERAGL